MGEDRTMKALTLAVLAAAMVFSGVAGAQIKDITWRIGPNLPEFRKGGCATVLNGKVVSVFGMRQPWGEMDTMYIYDPQTDWWTRGPNGPVGQCYVQGTEWGNAFYAVGGRKGQVRTECYRLGQKGAEYVWSDMPPLVEPRGWAPSAAVDDKLFVFGGAQGGHGPTLNSVEMLDLKAESPSWKKVAEIPGLSRGWLGAAAAGQMIYLFGGYHFYDPKPAEGPDRARLDEVWAFNPATYEWKAAAPIPYGVSGLDVCVYKDRYVILVGGSTNLDEYTPELRERHEKTDRYESYYCPFVSVYDTQKDTWSIMPSVMPVPTNDIRVVTIGNTVYALGGENIEPATSNTTPWLRIGEIVE